MSLNNIDSAPNREHTSCLIHQIDESTWILGGHLLTRTPYQSASATWNDAAENASYNVRKIDTPIAVEAMKPLQSNHFKLLREIQGHAEVWAVGSSAICKVEYSEIRGVASESAILDYVRSHDPSFVIPEVYYYFEHGDYSHLFMQKLPGLTLEQAWPTLTGLQKGEYVMRVVEICAEMAQWTQSFLSGVNGTSIKEDFLTHTDEEYLKENMLQTCKDMGMDCTTFHFGHPDLGPSKLIINDQLGSEPRQSLCVIGFENAGFFPKQWIGTKFRLNCKMNLESYPACPYEYRITVANRLAQAGFGDVAGAWIRWQTGCNSPPRC